MKLPKACILNLSKGITLVEVLITIAIFALLVGFSLPLTLDFYHEREFDVNFNNIVQALRRAQLMAMSAEGDSSFGVYFEESRYTLFRGDSFYQSPPDPSWYDGSWQYRQRITVSTGGNSPYGGYQDYTVRIASLDTSSLISAGKMRNDCNDLRILYWSGTDWTEIDRHLINCNTPSTDIRFKLLTDIAANSSDDNYYLYYGNPSASSPNPLGTTNVYLWYDDASVNLLSSYVLGRGDNWAGSGYQACTYDNTGHYYKDCGDGDNYNGSMRREVDERDVFIEAEFYYDCAWPGNQSTGLLARYQAAGGSGATEYADHYYASNRAEMDVTQNCGAAITANGYGWDGDIIKTNLGVMAIDGINLSDVVSDQWTKQGLAIWGINHTHGKFWYSDSISGFGPSGWPIATLLADGLNAMVPDGFDDYEGAGDAGIIVSQNRVRIRNIFIRRYTEPEPSVSFGEEEFLSGNRDTSYDEVFEVPENFSLSGLSEVVFDKVTGAPSDAGDITFSGYGRSENININEIGKIESGIWNLE